MRQCGRIKSLAMNAPRPWGDNSARSSVATAWRFGLVAILCSTLGLSAGCTRVSAIRHRWFARETTVPSIELGQAPQTSNRPPARSPRLPSRRSGILAGVSADRWHQLGESVEGRAIEARLIGSGPFNALLIGGIHGDEPEGLSIVDRFAEELALDQHSASRTTLLVVRNLNPDGTAYRTRTNQNGVDLNRNFPASNWDAAFTRPQYNPGERPESEPETQLLVRLIREFQPHRILVMHSTRGKPLVNFDGPARELAESMSRYNGYVTSDTIGYPTPGSLGSYAGVDMQIPIITLELPRGIQPGLAWEANRDALYQFLQ